MSQKLNPKLTSSTVTTEDTKSETTDKTSTQWGTVAQQPEKKDYGWLSYINEKLHQWPLWVKLVGTEPAKEEKPSKFTSQLKQQLEKKGYRVILTKKLIIDQWGSRSGDIIRYNYYHDEKAQLTYFFPFSFRSEYQQPNAKGAPTNELPSEFKPHFRLNSLAKFVWVMNKQEALKEIGNKNYFE